MFNFFKKNFFINFILVLTIFGLDRITKNFVISQSKINLSNDLFLSNYLNISLMWNEGIAFGLFGLVVALIILFAF